MGYSVSLEQRLTQRQIIQQDDHIPMQVGIDKDVDTALEVVWVSEVDKMAIRK